MPLGLSLGPIWVLGPRCRTARILLLEGPGREKIGASLECGAPEEVLSVKVITWTSITMDELGACLSTYVLLMFDAVCVLYCYFIYLCCGY